MKTEEAAGSEGVHSRKFLFKFENSPETYTIQCEHPQTVLQAITSKREIREKIECDKDKIILQKGEARLGTAIATHFPCTGLKNRELVTLMRKNETVEVIDENRDYRVYLDERYYVVYIETKGGLNTRSKTLLNSVLLGKFSKLCVYGTENMTLKDAIERDGRFVELGDFKLESTTKGKMYVFSDDKIQQHDGQTFKICLGKQTSKKAGEASSYNTDEAVPPKTDEAASNKAGEMVDAAEAAPSTASASATLSDVAPLRRVPVTDILKRKQAAGGNKERDEVYELLQKQFPELKKQLLSRYQDTFKRVDFGKAQQAFSDVFRLEKLLKLGKSVCKITISNTCEGTGFVLFKRYILTNAHLFDAVIYNNSLQPDLGATALFNYEEPHQQSALHFKVKNTFIDYDKEIDYAILELVVSEENEGLVPPGLMKHCCPMPPSGEACLIGHPNGGIKKFDPTCIIEKEKREEEVKKHLERFENNISVLSSVFNHIQKQGIERILCPPDPHYDQSASYHTHMFHGSSGSPVFDAHCRVFGMHTGGFTYGVPKKDSVIEFARPVLLIFNQFVTNLRTSMNRDLLREVEEESKENQYLRQILDIEEAMDES